MKEAIKHSQATLDRFMGKVHKTETCWLWKGCKNVGGYGLFRFPENTPGAHRVSYELFKGPIPEGLYVLHSCDIRHCVNPAHLRIGTLKENTQDMFDRGRQKKTKFTPSFIAEIRHQYFTQGKSIKDIRRVINIGQRSILQLLKGGEHRMFLQAYEARGVGEDDREKIGNSNATTSL